MANTILTATAVTREALRVLHQKLNFVGNVTRDYDASFAQEGAKIGDTLKIRLPNRYTVRTGATMSTQQTTETSVDLKVQTQKGVDLGFTDAELALSLDDFSERIITPAMSVLAASIEADALSMYKDVFQQVNNAGSAVTTEKIGLSMKALDDALAPPNDRTLLLNTQDNVDGVEAMKGLFVPQDVVGNQIKQGMVGRTWNYGDVYTNTLLTPHARGTAAATSNYQVDTTAINASSATEVTTLTFAAGTGTLAVGEVFTVATLYRVHPESKVSTGALHQFVATAAVSGTGSVSISPSIYTAGPRQNVTIVSASATAAVSIAGTASTSYGVSLAFQKGAFAFATADLPVPKGMDMASRQVFEGISMRFVRGFDILNGQFLSRVDVLYGYKTIRPQLACRLANR